MYQLGRRANVFLQQQSIKHPFCTPNIQIGAEDIGLPATAGHKTSFLLTQYTNWGKG
jgi:hypothetical protein